MALKYKFNFIQDAGSLIAKLTRFVREIFDALAMNRRPALLLAVPGDATEHSSAETPPPGSTISTHSITISRNVSQTVSFCRFVKVMQIVYSLLKLGKVSTKRGL
jgi:hypothetical protein